jgi:hypothetical protein
VRGLFLLLHVLSASTWLGAALWVAGDVKRTLALGRPAAEALPARVSPALRLDLLAGVATIITGVAILALDRLHPAPGIVAGMALALARFGVVAFAMIPSWKAIEALLASGADLAEARPLARRLAMLSGVAHTFWLLALAGMVFQG